MNGAARPTVAVIPARGGSKGVPGKNLRLVGGLPLVVRAIRACRAAARINVVVVSTDDDAIAAAAAGAGARVVRRPDALAGDTATSESALLHALDALAESGAGGEGLGTSPVPDAAALVPDAAALVPEVLVPEVLVPEVLVFVQCTSPFLDSADLDRAVELVASGGADSAFSAVETYEFLWRRDPAVPAGAATVIGVNHDAAYRPRRQDRQPDYRETGAFYVMTVEGFRRSRHRFFGRTAVVPVAEHTALEIDSPLELAMAEALATLVDTDRLGGSTVDEAARLEVDAVVTDFDGVHTDDAALVDQDGRESVRVSRADGLGVAALRAAGYPLLILSKERNPVVTARAAKLGVEVLQGIDDKVAALTAWLQVQGLDPGRVAYLGNDVNDLGPMALVGWPVAVADARPPVRAAARLVLGSRGGHGAVRELCDRVLEAGPRRVPASAAPGHSGPGRAPTVPAAGTGAAPRPAFSAPQPAREPVRPSTGG